MEPASDNEFRAGMQRWCTGVSVVTAHGPSGRHGMTVSAFSSVSAAPPTVLVCMSSAARTTGLIAETGWFAVNVLAAGQAATSDRFAGRDGNVDRFEGIGWTTGLHDLPLIEGVVAQLECSVDRRVEVGDHTIFFGLVVRVHTNESDPLLYYRGDYQSIVYGRRIRPREDS